MTVARTTEISASSPTSFEGAINTGLSKANETLDHIEGAWVKDMKVKVSEGRVSEYRVVMKLTFVLR